MNDEHFLFIGEKKKESNAKNGHESRDERRRKVETRRQEANSINVGH